MHNGKASLIFPFDSYSAYVIARNNSLHYFSRILKTIVRLKHYEMNRLKAYIFILIMSLGTGIFAQSMSQQQWSKMRDDAFLDFIQSGGTTEQWQHYSEQIVQEYLNRNYQTNSSGQQVLKQNYVNGTFLSGAGVEGYFYNNYVLNSAQQPLGYFNNVLS